jgi:hypothetical protein
VVFTSQITTLKSKNNLKKPQIMKNAILTFGLSSLVMILTSFTTPETNKATVNNTTGQAAGQNAVGGNVKLDAAGQNAVGGNVKLDAAGQNAVGGNVKLDAAGQNAVGGNVKLD